MIQTGNITQLVLERWIKTREWRKEREREREKEKHKTKELEVLYTYVHVIRGQTESRNLKSATRPGVLRVLTKDKKRAVLSPSLSFSLFVGGAVEGGLNSSLSAASKLSFAGGKVPHGRIPAALHDAVTRWQFDIRGKCEVANVSRLASRLAVQYRQGSRYVVHDGRHRPSGEVNLGRACGFMGPFPRNSGRAAIGHPIDDLSA